jgi:hypothetical protein
MHTALKWMEYTLVLLRWKRLNKLCTIFKREIEKKTKKKTPKKTNEQTKSFEAKEKLFPLSKTYVYFLTHHSRVQHLTVKKIEIVEMISSSPRATIQTFHPGNSTVSQIKHNKR